MWVFAGLVCFLLVVGSMVNGKPVDFAVKSLVAMGALAFLAFVLASAHTIWSDATKGESPAVDYPSARTSPDFDW